MIKTTVGMVSIATALLLAASFAHVASGKKKAGCAKAAKK